MICAHAMSTLLLYERRRASHRVRRPSTLTSVAACRTNALVVDKLLIYTAPKALCNCCNLNQTLPPMHATQPTQATQPCDSPISGVGQMIEPCVLYLQSFTSRSDEWEVYLWNPNHRVASRHSSLQAPEALASISLQ